MYLTMNRFKVKRGQEAAFEAVWTGRDSQLTQVKGFVAFHLLKGPEKDGYRLYASHTAWERRMNSSSRLEKRLWALLMSR